eukprot:jgi/Tetstr1/464431/TSEL_000104.t1
MIYTKEEVKITVVVIKGAVWKEWAHLIGPGFSIQASPDLSAIPKLMYDISSDETHRQLIVRRHWATLDQYRSLYSFGFYDAVDHAALCEALASIKRAASSAQPLDSRTNGSPQPPQARFRGLRFGSGGSVADYELLRLEAEYNVKAAAMKAAVQKRFGVGPDPNEDKEDDYEPPSRARWRWPSGRRPRPDFRHTADDADKVKGKGKA